MARGDNTRRIRSRRTSYSEMFDRIAETRFDVIRDQLTAQNIWTMLASVEQQSESLSETREVE